MARVDPNWKKAQDKVKEVLGKYESQRKNFWTNEFPDTYQAQGNFIQEQPSDRWFLLSGKFGLIEVKTCEQDRFPFKDIRSSQIRGTTRVLAASGISIYLICKLPEWQWHRVPGALLLNARNRGEKSMPWSDMTPIKLTAEEILYGLLDL